MRAPATLGLVAACLVWAAPARADVIGPLLPRGVVDLGAFYSEPDRDLRRGDIRDTWHEGWWYVAMRAGVTETVTAAAEFSTVAGQTDDDYNYSLGAALQTRMWLHDQMRATTRVSYRQQMRVARTGGDCDYVEKWIEWNAQFEQAFDRDRFEFTWWAGPTLSFLRADPQPPCNAGMWESDSVLGAFAGMSAVYRQAYVVSAQLTYVDRFEPTILLALRF